MVGSAKTNFLKTFASYTPFLTKNNKKKILKKIISKDINVQAQIQSSQIMNY